MKISFLLFIKFPKFDFLSGINFHLRKIYQCQDLERLRIEAFYQQGYLMFLLNFVGEVRDKQYNCFRRIRRTKASYVKQIFGRRSFFKSVSVVLVTRQKPFPLIKILVMFIYLPVKITVTTKSIKKQLDLKIFNHSCQSKLERRKILNGFVERHSLPQFVDIHRLFFRFCIRDLSSAHYQKSLCRTC